MVMARMTMSDPSLMHQISLHFMSGRPQVTRVFCHCRLDSLGEFSTGRGDPWPIYNNSDNHVGEFTPTSTAKVYDVQD